MPTRYSQAQVQAYNKANESVPMDEDSNGFMTDEQLVQKYKKEVQAALTHTETWRNKQERWHQQRMRMKKKKVFPFADCSNLKMPTDERHIRKKKAKLVQRIFGIRPIVQAVPPPSGSNETAIKIEKWMDHLIMDIMKFFPIGVMAIDKMLEGGFQPFKPFWRTETTRRTEVLDLHDMTMEEMAYFFSHGTDPDWIKQEIIRRFSIDMNPLVAEFNDAAVKDAIVRFYSGEEEIEIEVEDIVYNAPDVATPNAERIIVPPNSPINPQRCEWICHDLDLSYLDLMSRIDSGYKNLDILMEKLSKKTTKSAGPAYNKEQMENYREGIERYEAGGTVRIWEIYTWEKIKPTDSKPRKCVLTIAPDFNIMHRRVSLDTPNGAFPITRINNELTDDRWYSPRGIPEIITDIVKEIDVQKNQKIDSQTSRNAPMFKYRVGIINPRIKLRPNRGIPVPAGIPFSEVFEMINNTNLNAEFSYKDEIMQLNAETEELLGEVNFTLQSQINKRQPRTGVEVDAQIQGSMPLATLEADVVAHGFTELFQMLFALWCQHGDDEMTFQYFGSNPNGIPETIKLNKEELQGHIIVVKGNDSNTNPQIRLQKANAIAQLVADPVALQMGIIKPQNYYNAKRESLQQLGVNPDLFITPPPPPQPPPPPIPDVKMTMEDLTPIEQIQLKGRLGLNPDLRGNVEAGIRKTQKSNAEIRKLNSDARPGKSNK